MTKKTGAPIHYTAEWFVWPWPGCHIELLAHNQATILRLNGSTAFAAHHEHSVPTAKSRKNNDKAFRAHFHTAPTVLEQHFAWERAHDKMATVNGNVGQKKQIPNLFFRSSRF